MHPPVPPRGSSAPSLAEGSPCLHSPVWSLFPPEPKAARRQGVNEASSGIPLIDCKLCFQTTHLTLVINWGFLPDLRDDSIPPEDNVFSAGILPRLEPSPHTGLSRAPLRA